MTNPPPRLPKILYSFLIETLGRESASREIRTTNCAAGEIVLSARAPSGGQRAMLSFFIKSLESTGANTKGLAKSIRNFRKPLTS